MLESHVLYTPVRPLSLLLFGSFVFHAKRISGVLADAQYVYNNAIDVSIDMYGTKAAAASIYEAMQERRYSFDAWSDHELHPKLSEGFSEVEIVNFIFTMDLLNFSYGLFAHVDH